VQISGRTILLGSRSRVWSTLIAGQSLEACIPGCQRFVAVGPQEWEIAMSIGLAGIKGAYTGRVRITDQVPLERYTLSLEGTGSGNRIRGSGTVELADGDGETTIVTWDGEAQIAGTLASIGQRLFQPAARMLAEQFFQCMGSRLVSGPPA
jgi:carbon monoxide dehydrogenase subunit G